MSSDGRSTRPCALTAYPPATASPYLEQTGSTASTKALWSPSSMAASSPRPQFGEVLLPYLAERSRQAQPAPVTAEQARVQPTCVVLSRDCRGQYRHVVQVALYRVRQVKAPVPDQARSTGSSTTPPPGPARFSRAAGSLAPTPAQREGSTRRESELSMDPLSRGSKLRSNTKRRLETMTSGLVQQHPPAKPSAEHSRADERISADRILRKRHDD